MDKESQAIFDEIVAMDQEALTIEQKGFLMARRSYLNDEQRKRYADMIKLHEAGKLIPVKEEEEVEEDLESLSLAKLKKIATAEKVEVKGLKTVKEFARAIKATREQAEDAE